jgi:hypothetical protein
VPCIFSCNPKVGAINQKITHGLDYVPIASSMTEIQFMASKKKLKIFEGRIIGY